MFAVAGAAAAGIAGSLAFWKAKREVNAMFDDSSNTKAEERIQRVHASTDKEEQRMSLERQPQMTERANRRDDLRHKYGMDRKTSDAYEAPLSVKVTGTRRSEFQARHAAIVSHRLFIYKSRSDATPEQRLDLAHADLALVGDDSSNCTFVLRTQDNKQHFFRCDTARATTEWQVALSRAIKAASMAAK